jgi:hypothetical protein
MALDGCEHRAEPEPPFGERLTSKKTGDISHTCRNRRSDILPLWKMYPLDRRTTNNWPNDAWRLRANLPRLPWPKHLERLRWII